LDEREEELRQRYVGREDLTEEEKGEVEGFLAAREELENRQVEDLVRWGWKLESWDEVLKRWQDYAIHVILGGNRSSKSSLLARLVVHLAETVPEAEIRCYHVDERRSVEDQQTFVWEALPERYKEMGKVRGRNFSVQYTQSNGFVGDKLILPPQPGYKRGSTIYFGNYNQYRQNSQVTEGFKCHLVWCDEEVPPEMFNTLLLRLTDYRGRIFLTFTTLKGWTALVSRILGRTRTLRARWARYANKDLPVLQESISQPDCVVHYFWTEDNPFIPKDGWLKKLEGRPVAERLARLYGVPMKSATTVFPKFSEVVHVIPHSKLPWLREGGQGMKYPVTRYMVVDGAGARNWFMLWVAIDAAGTWWVYREWPDLEMVGEWAEPGSNPGGAKGPAQQSLGFGTQDYVNLIRKLEAGEMVFERYIDPRFGSTEKTMREGTITPEEELSQLGMDFLPAKGAHEDAGLQVINTLLSYDEEKPVTTTNSPKLFISERCANLIFSMKEYTATAGKDEPTKDPVDCLRYLAITEVDYIDLSEMRSRKRLIGGY
jgi:phage terminase large subunit-like protein